MSAFEAIDIIAKNAAREELNTYQAQLRYLTYWWSNKYNRPLKDPLLQEYTIEELYYEYRLGFEFDEAEKEKTTEENDKIEEQKHDSALAWAEAEEAKELEELNSRTANSKEVKMVNKEVKITHEDEEWMKKQIEIGKETYGDSFGEDITEEFSDEW